MRLCQKFKNKGKYTLTLRCEFCNALFLGLADKADDFKPENLDAMFCPKCGKNSNFETKAEKKF